MNSREATIASVTIAGGPGLLPGGIFDQAPCVMATLTTGAVVELFSFYSRERSFDEQQFVGLTLEEGRRLKFAARYPRPVGGPTHERRIRSSWLPNDTTTCEP
jgi:hypothetical protein